MKIPRQSYTWEFNELAVKRVKYGHSYSAVAKELCIKEQTLNNWSSVPAHGALTSSRTNPVTEEQMELSRLRAENARLKRENEIIKRAAAYFAKDAV